MTIWTPRTEGGIRTQWHPEEDGTWEDSDILVYSTQIKQVRITHVENVYRYMWHYLTEEGWKHPKRKNKRIEDFYGEYTDHEGHKEVRWWWRAEKSPGGISHSHPFFIQKLYLDALTTGMKRTEIMYKGKKIKPYAGELLIWFNTVLVIDPKNWFTKDGPFPNKVLTDFWDRMIYKDRIREQEVELRRFSQRFIDDLKYFIDLRRTSDTRKPMEPEKQWH